MVPVILPDLVSTTRLRLPLITAASREHDIRDAVARAGGKALLEASGGIKLDNLKEYAETGVDLISVGALTHSAKAIDLSLEVEA